MERKLMEVKRNGKDTDTDAERKSAQGRGNALRRPRCYKLIESCECVWGRWVWMGWVLCGCWGVNESEKLKINLSGS